MKATSLTLDWKKIFEDTWDQLLPSLSRLFESIKVPIWDNFLKDWLVSNAIWLGIIIFIFAIGWPITKNERRKYRKWYFSIWGLVSAVLFILAEVYHIV